MIRESPVHHTILVDVLRAGNAQQIQDEGIIEKGD